MKDCCILVNLGSPRAGDKAAARAFLAQFLADRFVLPVKNAFLRNCAARIIARLHAAAYARSTLECAPAGRGGESALVLHTKALARELENILKKPVYAAFRYGEDCIESVSEKAAAKGAECAVYFPLYPQAADSTTLSVAAEIARVSAEVFGGNAAVAASYYDAPEYIEALALTARAAADRAGGLENFDAIAASYHSVPMKGSYGKYSAECKKTSSLLGGKLAREVHTLWQSKMGRGKWLEPTAESFVLSAPERGIKKILFLCPGFACDCTETLLEISKNLGDKFRKRGGECLVYVPCLNATKTHAQMIAQILERAPRK